MEQASIEGYVTDVTGAVLPGVTVVAESEAMEGARTTVTNAEGRYRFDELNPGDYTVTFTMDGFMPAEKSCTVKKDETAECVAALKIAEPEEG